MPDGDVLIAGAADHDGPGGMASAEVFRSSTPKFEAVQSMHVSRISHTATLLKDGRVLITGGRGEMVTKSAELHNPKTRAFVQAGDTLFPFICDGHLVISGIQTPIF